MLHEFVTIQHLIPESFKKNDDARLKVYDMLLKLKSQKKINFEMTKSEFLVMNEDVYFNMLFNECRSEILNSVKYHYDSIEDGFFRERFQIFLESKLVNLQNIIKFIDFFDGSEADDVRIDVFNCIKKLLKITDFENTREFIEKSLDK